jgi:hypothetical protein
MLKVIEGIGPKAKLDFCSIYLNAYNRKLSDLRTDHENRTTIKQLVFYGVRHMNLLNYEFEDIESIETRLTALEVLFEFIGDLTPTELITIFPVDKVYDGDKFQCKDYFFTMDELRKIGMNKRIGPDNVLDLIWDYQNHELRELLVKYMGIMSDIRKVSTGIGIMEEWADDNNIEILHVHKDPVTQKEYVQNSRTGKITPVKRRKPCHLKVVRLGSHPNR